MICDCGCRESVCDYEGNEQCVECGAKNPRKLLSYIDEAEYSVVLGKMYPSNDLKERIRAAKILDKQVMIK